MIKAIIISDKKPGHVNQCIAIAKILDYEYEINESYFKSSLHQLLSYILDFLNIYSDKLFIKKKFNTNCDIVISAGSTTYYINKYYAKMLNIPNIAIQLPRGYRLNFTKIICPKYDKPPKSCLLYTSDAADE